MITQPAGGMHALRKQIDDMLPESVQTVLETMFFNTAEARAYLPPPELAIQVTVEFRGALSGRFWLCVAEPTAFALAADFLGAEGAEIGLQRAQETARELANMICGSVLSRIEPDNAFELGGPELLPGGGDQKPWAGAHPCAQHFDIEGGWLSVALEPA